MVVPPRLIAMRSLGFTFFLIILAACVSILAAIQWSEGNFDLLFGHPPTPVGDRLYDDFKSDDVKQITIETNGTTAKFTLTSKGWQATAPWTDRMDPRSAVAIINFTLGMRVEDLTESDNIDKQETGLNGNGVSIRLADEDRETLAYYKMGRLTPWKAEFEEQEQLINTVFIKTKDENRKDYVYVCTGDITQLFNSGLKLLRDHRPFYVNPLNLQKISIRTPQGELTLGREQPRQAWRIVKPLDLPTDPQAMKILIEGLYNLRAIDIHERAEVTLPATDNATKNQQIAITRFGSDEATVLDVFPPESPEANETIAIISDRPNTVFDLPIKPLPGIVSLADLPLDVNTLRDPTLTHLNVAALKSISIDPITGNEIIISRTESDPWMASIGDDTFLANEGRLFDLLKAVTTTRAIGFESDAASDFSPWGLDRPILVLRFLATNNEALELRFGISTNGDYFVNRLGTPTVMKVDPSLIRAIAIHPYEWKHGRLWSINRFNLTSLVRQKDENPPIILKYAWADDKWSAEKSNKDITPQLISSRANFVLGKIEGLEVFRWLAEDDAKALQALTQPSMAFTAFEEVKDDDDQVTGVTVRTLLLAPTNDPSRHGYYYGLMNQQPHPFLITSEQYDNLAIELLEE